MTAAPLLDQDQHDVPPTHPGCKVAALLPARTGRTWAVRDFSSSFRPAAVQLTDGTRTLLIAFRATTEVFSHTPGMNQYLPLATLPGTEPATVARELLRNALPQVDQHLDSAASSLRLPGRNRARRVAALTEVHAALAALGTNADPFDRSDDLTGLDWTAAGERWRFSLHACKTVGTLAYEGPLDGLERVLPRILPPPPARVPRSLLTHVSGAVARRLISAWPHTLRQDEDGDVQFGTHHDPCGLIYVGDAKARARDSSAVLADISRVGVDHLLTILPDLI
ncbi:hypothetical protein G3I60_04985 [Streptomyces sp. SID13666]|uniref:hypothetical protein n=1 Tax=Streptomyces sp. SID13666 TaxID=2706054 RepID=UPI0013C2461F|nr:hypothetical protein [Streptomyces sp. SID13666]NEA53524.1 hypothetical protein [Streptomyces sp. SID13666]